MVFISERIINISELEALLSETRLNCELLITELQGEAPQNRRIEELALAVRNKLVEAEKFEFCIEKRKCIFKADSENPMSVEKLINEDSQN